MNTSKYDHFTQVVLTWSICVPSSPVSCVCDVYPGLSPSASCLRGALSACAWGAGLLIFRSTHNYLKKIYHNYHCIITKAMTIDTVTNESILDQYGGVRNNSLDHILR